MNLNLIAAMFNGGLSALNAALYVHSGDPLSLFAAIFCGFMCLVSLTVAAMTQ